MRIQQHSCPTLLLVLAMLLQTGAVPQHQAQAVSSGLALSATMAVCPPLLQRIAWPLQASRGLPHACFVHCCSWALHSGEQA